MIRIPNYMRDPERYLWAAIVLSLVVLAATDPWFMDSIHWWLFGAGALLITGVIAYLVGVEVGRKKERYSRHTLEQQIKANAAEQSAWLRRR